ncbi:MAG: DUF211 domain-containing protein [Proteobacteria bacterium]|jgi:hypothetical protein|nr:hypothetical protein [Desulfocapsa sp.]MBU3945370.1 DUF211 domain-containing protein [Pseudomonadota bacterium]MCG2743318.1 DUF211 domain-containing protein [Desulfobacteraceae bacterium]MDO8947001.1 DUF211 domain-containing protein [Desulfocapsaceae bacterium]MBU3982637.1 DUF211 domain-containing protein [Pseudomonadota bacterium]
MTKIRRLVLDVLKPHQPNALDFASALADIGSDYHVILTVTEVDKKTESTMVTIEGADIHFDNIKAIIEKMGGSVHSIDEVEVYGAEPT